MAPSTRPYFSRPNIEQPYYDISNPRSATLPQRPTPLIVHGRTFDDQGVHLELAASCTPAGNPDTLQPSSSFRPSHVSLSPVHGNPPPRQQNFRSMPSRPSAQTTQSRSWHGAKFF